jgi:uncharacterized integral membrane protein
MIGLLLTLIVGSFLPIPYLGIVLATVRLLLVMELGVALVYLGIVLRRQVAQPIIIDHGDEVVYAIERGN